MHYGPERETMMGPDSNLLESPKGDTETDVPAVLIAEDEALVRFALSDCLSARGMVVHEAGSAHEAIEILETIDQIDLVFSDIRMPGGVDGLGLAHWLREHRPDVTVVLTSGDVRRSDFAWDSGVSFVAKPYSLDAVVAYIAALVNHANGAPPD